MTSSIFAAVSSPEARTSASLISVLEADPKAAVGLAGTPESCLLTTAADYDPLDDLNSIFSHPSTLSGVSAASTGLSRHLFALDDEISTLVQTQSSTNADSLSRIRAAQMDLVSLFANIDTVRDRAMRTEEAITEMTKDIKRLDSTKRNLTLSMTVLKRLQMLTTAFEQLKSNTKTRQYRECSGLLSAVLELMAHFKTYRSIDQIATLSKNVHELKQELLEQVCEDFELAFIKGEVANKKVMLAEACAVMDALGDTARQRLINWYCNTQLREYRQVFRGNDEAGSLDNIPRRYAWFKRMMKVYEDEHAAIFPFGWRANEVLASSFCEGTRDDFRGILQKAMRKEGGKSLDVNLLLTALQETLEFEHYLERTLGNERMSIDTLSSAMEAPRTLVGEKSISSAFEPYLSLWVDFQDTHLSKMLPKYRNAPLRPSDPEEDFSPLSSVLPSSIELFHFYRQCLSQCAKLSTGPKLLDLSKTFQKYLDLYADTVLSVYINPERTAVQQSPIEELAVVLNTADYCYTTTSQLEDKLKSRIEKPLDGQISFEKQTDNFLSVISRSITLFVSRNLSLLDPAWREMRNLPWSRMDVVGDASAYTTLLTTALTGSVSTTLAVLHKETWRRTFCDRIVDALVTQFTQTLVASRPISEIGAEQGLLDAYVLKKCLEELLALRPREGDDAPPPPPPQTYLRHVARSVGRVDALLKTLQVGTHPQEGLVTAYLIHVADSSVANFRKILDLKGIRKADQASWAEIFKAHATGRQGIAEQSVVMRDVVLGPVGEPVKEEAVAGRRFGGLGDVVLQAARDAGERIERAGSEMGDSEGGKEFGLGRLFRRDGRGR